MQKKTSFTRVQAVSDTQPEVNPLAPYTNTCSFSVKLGEAPQEKQINGYVAIMFSACHWQPKGKPPMWLTCYVYDSDLSTVAKMLKKGQSCIISGKFAFDIHQGVAKMFVLVDTIKL